MHATFSYCLNNPFRYTDPSGDFLGWIIAGAIILTKFYLDGKEANNGEPNPFKWGNWQNATYTVGVSSGGGNTAYSAGVTWNGQTGASIGYSGGGVGFGYNPSSPGSLYTPMPSNTNSIDQMVRQQIQKGIAEVKSNSEKLTRFGAIALMNPVSLRDGIIDATLDAAYGPPVASVWNSITLDLTACARPGFTPFGIGGIYEGESKGSLFLLEVDGGFSGGWDIGISTSFTNYYYSGDPEKFKGGFLEGDRLSISGGVSYYFEGGYGVSIALNVDGKGNYVIGLTRYGGVSYPGPSFHINWGATKIRYLYLPKLD